MAEELFMRDPTSEASSTLRAPVPFPPDITGKTIALLDIAKERSNEFLDTLETRFAAGGFTVKRYRKASNSKNAAPEIVQAIVSEADIVVEALAD